MRGCGRTLLKMPGFPSESIVHDDGTGAQITFVLPVCGKHDGKDVQYTTFRISAVKDGKFLLLADLVGSSSEDGKTFCGTIIIPSACVESAEITMLGSPANSSRGVQTKSKVSTFKRVIRAKSWTDQK